MKLLSQEEEIIISHGALERFSFRKAIRYIISFIISILKDFEI